MTVATASPTIDSTLNKLDISKARWIKACPAPQDQDGNTYFGADPASVTDNHTLGRESLRRDCTVDGQDTTKTYFPDEDSEGNMCRVLTVDPRTGENLSRHVMHQLCVRAIYPDGTIVTLPLREKYLAHEGKKLSHFALAALAAWNANEVRDTYAQWGTENGSNKFSPVMWDRALIQGYLKPSDNDFSSGYGKRIRTNKSVEVKMRRRSSRRAVWPFSEKEHWFRIMSGSFQVTNSNLTKILKDGNSRNTSRATAELKEAYPVFSSASEFKKARKFFEVMSSKKNDKSVRSAMDMAWDPLRWIYGQMSGDITRHATRQNFTSLFNTPYACTKTAMMLNCIPSVNENGHVEEFKEITQEYFEENKKQVPCKKSVSGVWPVRTGYSGTRRLGPNDMNAGLVNSLNVDNLTHMFMVQLNELQILSNEDFTRWCQGNNLSMDKLDYSDPTFITTEPFVLFGYKVTKSLDYTCVCWG